MKAEDLLDVLDLHEQVRIMKIDSPAQLDDGGAKRVNEVLYKGRVKGMCWREWENIRGRPVAKAYIDWDTIVPCKMVLNIIILFCDRKAVKENEIVQ